MSATTVAVRDWFFIPSYHTPIIYNPRDLLALIVFLFDALLMGQLATVDRARAEAAIRRARSRSDDAGGGA